MTNLQPVPVTGDLDLSDPAFWGRPLTERHQAFERLRGMPPQYFAAPPPTPDRPDTRGYYALVRHADVAEASRNPAVFSSAAGAVNIADRPAEASDTFDSMINMDDPRHARLRRIVSRSFTPKMLQKFTDDVQRTAATIVSDLLETGPCDFVERVSARLPLTIICELMGIGSEHHEMVFRHTSILLSSGDPEYVSQDPDTARTQVRTAAAELVSLVFDLMRQREASPADDLISVLAAANVDGEQLTPGELAGFFILLLAAGNETTRNAISHALVLFTAHPDQRALLLLDFESRIGPAVEEIVRYASPVTWMKRKLTQDYTLNGHALAEGDKVLLIYPSANRDCAVFTDPGRFDITRSPNPHVGFGASGPHFCLGAHLARREITVMLRELLTRVPGIRAAGEPDYLRSSLINGIKHLPCELG